MSDSDISLTPPAEESVQLPGQVLRQAREARGYSIADVAQTLKFGGRQIEALEADDYAALPGAPFIRGFVRSYARFLKLDPAPLVATLGVQAPVELPDVRPPENMGTAMPATGVRQVPVLVAASVVLLVIATVIGGWQYLGGSVASTATVNGRAPAAASAVVPVLPPQVRVDSPAAEPAVNDVPVATVVPAAAPAPVAAPDPAARQLIFTFAEKSWVEVKDASGRIVFTGEQPAGSRQAVMARPPFQLVVGNAAKVDLQYEDRQVDLKPHTRAEVARLTLE